MQNFLTLNNVHIFIGTETWLNDNISDLYITYNYLIRNDRTIVAPLCDHYSIFTKIIIGNTFKNNNKFKEIMDFNDKYIIKFNNEIEKVNYNQIIHLNNRNINIGSH